MHISEGILSAPVLIAGAALTAAGTAIGLRRLDAEKVPLVGVMAAAFFVASGATRVPIGFSSAHLLLNGLTGLLLGWAVFPALLVALFLQALLLQFGGLTTLGVNTFTMAFPGVVAYLLAGGLMRRWPALTAVWAFAAGAGAVLLSAVLYAVALFSSGRAFGTTAVATLVAHLPIMPVEGLICALCVGFLRKVKPVMLPQRSGKEVSDEA
jgi:cobalt/nickel transport system permease protein